MKIESVSIGIEGGRKQDTVYPLGKLESIE